VFKILMLFETLVYDIVDLENYSRKALSLLSWLDLLALFRTT
jgi:hypothetical protein